MGRKLFISAAFRQLVCLVVMAGFIVAAVAAAENVYDKFRNRSYSNKGYLSEADEVKLGAQVHEELRKKTRFVTDPVVTGYVNSLGQKLVRVSQRPNLKYQFFVVDDKSINAFATLGGYVYVHTGLIKAANSEAQLASAIGHEIGHIVARHGLENVKQSQKYGTLAAITGAAAGILSGGRAGNLGDVAGQLIFGGKLMQHSRDAEREADYLGLYELNQAGYNTGGMVQMFEVLQKISASNPGLLGGVMASHPPARERADNTSREISARLSGSDAKGTATTREFQRMKLQIK